MSSILATESHFCTVPREFSPCLCRTSARAQPPNSPPWKISQRLLQMHPLQIEFWISPGWGLWDMPYKNEAYYVGNPFWLVRCKVATMTLWMVWIVKLRTLQTPTNGLTYSIFLRNTSESTAAFTKRSQCWEQFTSWRLGDAYLHLGGLKTGRSLQGQVPDIPGVNCPLLDFPV